MRLGHGMLLLFLRPCFRLRGTGVALAAYED